ncbi:MAG: hypothetical protein FWF56_00230 [Firmicutes bacterium]|nr:hypothetical protein [Bacillota bacterium]MCL1953990.1 hypothetical protein [Bacillota bacterium]
MQKQILYQGTKKSYSFVAAKNLAKRGYKIIGCNSLNDLVDKIDENSTAVLPFDFTDRIDHKILQILMTISQRDVYINQVIAEALDFRLFFIKTIHDLLSIKTIKMSELAYASCGHTVQAILPLASIKIVEEESVLDNLDENIVGVANVYNQSKELSMSPTSLLRDGNLTAKYCVLSNKPNYLKEAETILLSLETKELSVDMMSILGMLTMSNIELTSINTIQDKIILTFKGNVKDKNTKEILSSLAEIAKGLRVLGNI